MHITNSKNIHETNQNILDGSYFLCDQNSMHQYSYGISNRNEEENNDYKSNMKMKVKLHVFICTA